jgi:uncharacterized protein (TIGR02646 family)
MHRCQRGPAPEHLVEREAEIATKYAEKRLTNPGHQYRWPPALYAVVRGALAEMTQQHCAYCDGYPLDSTGEDQIDHFQPKSQPAFYSLVCKWDNLFLSCHRCNRAKLDQWEEALLRPDDPAFHFERFFVYEFDSGKVLPNPAASADDQHRAVRTIDILGLNGTGRCISRKKEIRNIRGGTAEVLADAAYRFLIPLCLDLTD